MASVLAALGIVAIGLSDGSPAFADNNNVVTLVNESFTGSQLTSGPWEPAQLSSTTTDTSNTTCLTSTPGTPIPECAPGVGNGTTSGLQLTTNGNSQAGGAVFGLSLPTADGIDASFNSYQWGGNGADGISFFLSATDPTNPQPPTLGPPGGSLAYAADSPRPGMPNGYLGFGLDVYGNYDNSGNIDTPDGCPADPAVPGGAANQVDVRGPGNGLTGYCDLASTYSPTTSLSGSLKSFASPPEAVPVEVALNPSQNSVMTTSGLTVAAQSWAIAVLTAGSVAAPQSGCPSGGWQCLSGSLPNATGIIPGNQLDSIGVPYQVAFGWGASTGGANDYHLINDLNVTTLTGVPPTYSLNLTDGSGGSVAPGQPVQFTATAGVTGTNERDNVTFTDHLPAGLIANPGADSGSDGGAGGSFTCSSTQESCTYTPPSGGLSAAESSQLTVQFAATVASLSSPQSLVNSVTASSGDGLPANATDTVTYAGPPAVTVGLSTSSPTVAGVESVSPTVLPQAAGQTSLSPTTGGTSSAPLGSIPLGSIPLGSIPLGSINFSSITLPGGGSAAQAIGSTLLSDLSISYPQGCGGSGAAGCTGWPGVLAGTSFANTPLEAVTLTDVLNDPVAAPRFDSVNFAGLDLSSSPLGSIPLGSIPLGSINLASSPLGSIPLGSIPLGSIPLGSIPLGSINLASSPLGSIPLGSIPLGSIPLGSIPLGSINLASSPLGSIPLGSIPLGSIPLGSIPLGSIPLGSISASVLPTLVDCVNNSSLCSDSTATLLDAQNAGAIISTATLAELGTYGTTTLADVNTATAGNLNGTTLAQLGSDGCTTSAQLGTDGCTTLAQLAAYGGTTLAQLGTYGGTTLSQLLTADPTAFSSVYPNPTVADLYALLVPPASFNWQSVDLSTLPLATNETSGGGGTATYTATISVANGPTTEAVSVTLPPTFAYVPHSAFLDTSSSLDPVSTTPLEWTLPQLAVGTHQLTFQANAGTGLGPATATISSAGSGPAFTTAAATVDVVDGHQPQISAASTPVAVSAGRVIGTQITPGNLNLGYLTHQGDVNDWSVTVPQNAELSLALTNLPGPYDLELFGPSAPQLQGTPTQTISGVTDTVPSATAGATTEATPATQDIPLTPPPGDQLLGLSNNPDGQSQFIQTTPLAAGTYLVQVSGYNGAFSPKPYLLMANVLGGNTTPSCAASASPGISYLGSLRQSASGPVTIPHGVNTLFLVDQQRLAAAFPNDAATIMSKLQSVASDSAAGVSGAVIPVDSYATVQDAYANWNSDPCSVPAANAVVNAISTVVDQIRANNPSVQNLVIVGADDQIPFARVADGATQSNERDYGASTFAGQNNVEADALSLGYYFSDDPYVASRPLGVGSATLYLPELGVGRVVESASQIESALDRFVASRGQLNATTSLTTGYSFLTAGSQAVSANLGANGLPPSTLTNLINDSWTTSELDSALASNPGVASINAHFDYSRALPAADNTNNTQTNLFTTSDVRTPPDSASFGGHVLFSMGCHSGLDVADAEVAPSGVTTPVDDWAKAFADSGALWVGNTGYGYADTDTIAYSAKLMSGFAGNLNGTMTIGQALAEAKQQYAAGNAVVSPYDLKALMEATFYGLPMYTLNGPPHAVATNTVTPTPDPTTGQPSFPVTVGLTQSPVSTANGSYYQITSVASSVPATQTGHQVTEYRPIEPLVSIPVTANGLVAHGALITSLSSTDTSGFTPVDSMPAVGAADAQPPSIGYAAFPGQIQRVASYGTFTSGGTGQADQLDLISGQFTPGTVPGQGTQRVFNSIGAQVFYDSASDPLAGDFNSPTITTSQGEASNTGVTFSVQADASSIDDPVTEVVVLYTDATNPGSWTEVPLSAQPGGTSWTGSGVATPSGDVQFVVEALDKAGNVAVSSNQGADFHKSAQPAITIEVTGSPVVNGFHTGPVTANVDAPSGSSYVLDGAAATPLPSDGQVLVSSPGEHTLTVNDPNNDVVTQAFAISSTQTTISLDTNANPADVGQNILITATVTAASSGAGTPTGSVEFLDNGTPVSGCGGAAGTLLSNSGAATCQLSYGLPDSRQITARYVPASGSFSASDAQPLTEKVQQAEATIVLESTPNPSVVGQAISYTATVAAVTPGPFQPGGYVEFLDGGTPISQCGGTSGVPVNAGTASCGVTYGSTGSHPVTATYLGDVRFHGPVTSAAAVQVVNPASTGVSPPSSSASPSVVGQPVTYNATVQVTGQGAGTPTGYIGFFDTNTPISACGGATGEPLSGATAACVITYSAPTASGSPHQITQEYLGNSNFSPSAVSTALPQVVNKANTTTVLTSNANPAVVGQTITLQATVQVVSPGASPLLGNVRFLDNNSPIGGSCGGSAGVAPVNGVAACTVVYGAPQIHQLNATYVGDANLNPSSTASNLTQYINQASTTTALVTSSPTVANQTEILSAGLSINTPGSSAATTPTGTFEFLDGGTPITACGGTGGIPIGVSLAASCAVTFGTGSHPITVVYSGDQNFLASGSTTQVVASAGSCTSWQGCNLKGANLSKANLSGLNLTAANLQNANLQEADLQNTVLQAANLLSANLTNVDAAWANFSSANVSKANLSNGNFTDANFSSANLNGSNLTDANFSNANVHLANLNGTIRTRTNFTGATT